MAKVKKELPASEQGFIIMQASYAGHFDSPAAALKILQDAESRFDHSVEYIKSIAATHMQLNNTEMATSYYAKALTLAKAYNANQWQINIFKRMMEIMIFGIICVL